MDKVAEFYWRIPRGWTVLALIALAWGLMLTPFAAFAQETDGVVVTVPPTTVVFEWGDFLAILLANLAQPDSVAWTIFGLVSAWVVSLLPGPLQGAWRMFQINQLLEKAIRAGMNSTAGAVAGERLEADVGNAVLAGAIQYAIDNGSKAAIDWAGGSAGIHNKLIARLDLEPGASIPLVPQ